MPMPKLLAAFELDADRRPAYQQSDMLKHYKIQLYLEDTPADAFSVTYELDQSYRVNKRTVTKNMPKFKERITSYGDYVINAAISTKSSPDSPSMIASSLSEALRRRYAEETTPEIQAAITAIQTDQEEMAPS